MRSRLETTFLLDGEAVPNTPRTRENSREEMTRLINPDALFSELSTLSQAHITLSQASVSRSIRQGASTAMLRGTDRPR